MYAQSKVMRMVYSDADGEEFWVSDGKIFDDEMRGILIRNKNDESKTDLNESKSDLNESKTDLNEIENEI
jgi:hypothetical protein